MGSSATVFVGVILSEQEVMDRFGSKNESKIYDKCPNDGRDNSRQDPYCSGCGNSLMYDLRTREGIDTYGDVECDSTLSEKGLDAYVLNEFNDGRTGAIIGRKIVRSGGQDQRDIEDGGEIAALDLESLACTTDVESKLRELEIPGEIRAYLVTSYSD